MTDTYARDAWQVHSRDPDLFAHGAGAARPVAIGLGDRQGIKSIGQAIDRALALEAPPILGPLSSTMRAALDVARIRFLAAEALIALPPTIAKTSSNRIAVRLIRISSSKRRE